MRISRFRKSTKGQARAIQGRHPTAGCPPAKSTTTKKFSCVFRVRTTRTKNKNSVLFPVDVFSSWHYRARQCIQSPLADSMEFPSHMPPFARVPNRHGTPPSPRDLRAGDLFLIWRAPDGLIERPESADGLTMYARRVLRPLVAVNDSQLLRKKNRARVTTTTTSRRDSVFASRSSARSRRLPRFPRTRHSFSNNHVFASIVCV